MSKDNKSMNKKIGIILLSGAIAIVIFVVTIVVENKIIYPNGQKKVYYSKTPISKNTEITKDNINQYFIPKTVNSDDLVDGAVINKADLLNKYIIGDVLNNEQISSNKLSNTEDRTKDIKDLREYSINFSDISSVDGGTVRAGDIIDLILTKTDQNSVTTQTELRNVLISKAMTNDGQAIDRSNTKLSASRLILDLSAMDAHKLDNALAQGKVKVLKVMDNSTYNDITIQSANKQGQVGQ